MTAYARGFRLHLKGGRVLDGAQFPGGQVVVMDDPEWGLCSGARSADLLTSCYPDSRIEWPDDQDVAADAAQDLDPAQPCTQHPHAPVIGGLCGACTQYGRTLPGTPTVAEWTGEQQGPLVSGGDVAPETGLPPVQPCTDPRHTGRIREQLGCTGPDPATT
ncbi:hypothetical protein ACFRH6_16905 [Streptomyces sp. NPDC056749]|uniref:hypothetical protein n=1 Tax=Streptomyces sp. NPDC056749 TaxID=3345936 RepID=UPI0036B77EF2